MDSWHSYPSIYTLGHRAITDLLNHPVQVEEKVDGSQFSFSVSVAGELRVRSKGATLHPDAPEALFTKAVETAKRLAPMLRPGWTYRGEYLQKPKHNALAYDRIPVGHVIIFDINPSLEEYLSYEDKAAEAERIGLECVPLLSVGQIADINEFRSFLERMSILGGQTIEGVVVKPLGYDLFGQDKHVLMGKFVSEAFKEVHKATWGESNPASKDIIQRIGEAYNGPARWRKAVQHLREAGQIEDSPRDIGLLIREIPEDVLRECESEIKEELFQWAWPHIRRIVTTGMAEWYKEELLKRQFDQKS